MTNINTTTVNKTFAVIGGTGKTGRRVAQVLAARGAGVRPLGRATSPRFDWTDPHNWTDALAAVDGVYVVFAPEIAMPGADRQLRQLGSELAALGIDRVVMMSGRGEQGAAAAEAALREQVPTTTVLRCSFLMQNFDEGFFAGQVAAGGFTLPVQDAHEPFVDAADVAEAATVALLENDHAGRTYEVTGPESPGMHEVAAALSHRGRPVRFLPQTPAAYQETLIGAGVPAEDAAATAHLFAMLLDGHNSAVSDDILRLIGRPARSVAEYVREARRVVPVP